MNQPHKHKDVIIAWANGEQIEYREPPLSLDWVPVDFPAWFDKAEYRVKPQPVIRTFRVALFKGAEYCTHTIDREEDSKLYEGDANFIAWLTDPIPYQVEELN